MHFTTTTTSNGITTVIASLFLLSSVSSSIVVMAFFPQQVLLERTTKSTRPISLSSKNHHHNKLYYSNNNHNHHHDVSETIVIEEEEEEKNDVAMNIQIAPPPPTMEEENDTTITAEEINARLQLQLNKLAEKDRLSKQLTKEDIDILYEDDDIVVVNKPTGVLSVPGKVKENPSMNQIVFDTFGCDMGRMDMMVVHRLGMDTSGCMVFTKTMDALRGMNTIFRTRQIERQYEALVCGHITATASSSSSSTTTTTPPMAEGIINLPIMRDYEFPPYMRISTDHHQGILATLDPDDFVGVNGVTTSSSSSSSFPKKLFEAPKESITKYTVVSHEELFGYPVTRVLLTSLSGRTHQLNVHMAAFGHPIVGDTTYGIGGDAVSHGGLTREELDTLIPNPSRASATLQRNIAKAVALHQQQQQQQSQQQKDGNKDTTILTSTGSCIHAKYLKFRHPVTNEEIELSSDAPF